MVLIFQATGVGVYALRTGPLPPSMNGPLPPSMRNPSRGKPLRDSVGCVFSVGLYHSLEFVKTTSRIVQITTYLIELIYSRPQNLQLRGVVQDPHSVVVPGIMGDDS